MIVNLTVLRRIGVYQENHAGSEDTAEFAK